MTRLIWTDDELKETQEGNNDQVYACNSFNERSQGAGSSRGDDH